MYVRYKKNIQENDLPRKRVRKASKIAGSGRQDLEIRCPERGRKLCLVCYFNHSLIQFGNKMPREGTETLTVMYSPFISHATTSFGNKMPREGTETCMFSNVTKLISDLEIRCPERGRKLETSCTIIFSKSIWK